MVAMKRFLTVGVIVVLAGALVAVAVIGGGDDDRTSTATRGDVAKPPCGPLCQSLTGLGASAKEVAKALPGRLEDFSAALQERGYRVGVTTPKPRDTPRRLWPEAGLRVQTGDGPVNIYAYRSERAVKASNNVARVPTLLARKGVDQIGGCGTYVYFGTRRVTDSRALDRVVRIARVCPQHGVGFIVVQ
jgi:hypothetical protein